MCDSTGVCSMKAHRTIGAVSSPAFAVKTSKRTLERRPWRASDCGPRLPRKGAISKAIGQIRWRRTRSSRHGKNPEPRNHAEDIKSVRTMRSSQPSFGLSNQVNNVAGLFPTSSRGAAGTCAHGAIKIEEMKVAAARRWARTCPRRTFRTEVAAAYHGARPELRPRLSSFPALSTPLNQLHPAFRGTGRDGYRRSARTAPIADMDVPIRASLVRRADPAAAFLQGASGPRQRTSSAANRVRRR